MIITTMEQIESKSRGRPFGVSLITVLYWIGGLFFLLFALAGGVGPALGSLGNLGGIIIVVLLALGFGALVIGYGLWKLQAWALWTAILLAGLDMTMRLYGTLSLDPAAQVDQFSSLINVAVMILEVVVIVYLFLRRRVFQEEQTLIEH